MSGPNLYCAGLDCFAVLGPQDGDRCDRCRERFCAACRLVGMAGLGRFCPRCASKVPRALIHDLASPRNVHCQICRWVIGVQVGDARYCSTCGEKG